ncbi:MAG TPA: hypothetical protein PK280_21455 [Planctomycetota bacterium]|nr:hypothetical protein [Planctomycetota bacterium]
MSSAALRAVFRDPIYRWEARRYWTWRRYLWIALALLAFAALGGGCIAWSVWLATQAAPGQAADFTDIPGLVTIFGLYAASTARYPLCFAASLAGSLLFVPERLSGQLEQFVLTPVSPNRFVAARIAGRLRGLLLFWLATCAILGVTILGMAVYGLPALMEERGASLTIANTLVTQLDLGLLLVLDLVVGACYSARARSTAGAVAMSLLMSFLVLPIILYAPALILSIISLAMTWPNPGTRHAYAPLFEVAGVLLHLAGTYIALKLWMRRTGRAAEKLFCGIEAES